MERGLPEVLRLAPVRPSGCPQGQNLSAASVGPSENFQEVAVWILEVYAAAAVVATDFAGAFPVGIGPALRQENTPDQFSRRGLVISENPRVPTAA